MVQKCTWPLFVNVWYFLFSPLSSYAGVIHTAGRVYRKVGNTYTAG